MKDQVLRLLDPSALVSIPWHLRSKVGGPHLLQSWDQTHHHFIRQVGEDLLHLQCHSYLQVQAALVDHIASSSHCKIFSPSNLEILGHPLRSSRGISRPSSSFNLHRPSRHSNGKIQVREAAHGDDPRHLS